MYDRIRDCVDNAKEGVNAEILKNRFPKDLNDQNIGGHMAFLGIETETYYFDEASERWYHKDYGPQAPKVAWVEDIARAVYETGSKGMLWVFIMQDFDLFNHQLQELIDRGSRLKENPIGYFNDRFYAEEFIPQEEEKVTDLREDIFAVVRLLNETGELATSKKVEDALNTSDYPDVPNLARSIGQYLGNSAKGNVPVDGGPMYDLSGNSKKGYALKGTEAAKRHGFFEDSGEPLEVTEPSESISEDSPVSAYLYNEGEIEVPSALYEDEAVFSVEIHQQPICHNATSVYTMANGSHQWRREPIFGNIKIYLNCSSVDGVPLKNQIAIRNIHAVRVYLPGTKRPNQPHKDYQPTNGCVTIVNWVD